MYVHIYRHRPSKMYCTYIQCSFSLTDSYCNPLKFFIRKAVDMFKKVAKEDFSNMLYLSKHFLGDERLRDERCILCSPDATPTTLRKAESHRMSARAQEP